MKRQSPPEYGWIRSIHDPRNLKAENRVTKELRCPRSSAASFPEDTSLCPDGKRIVTASADKTARLWNADGTGAPLELSNHESALVAGAPGGGGAFSPDGTRLVTISNDEAIRVGNADGSGEPLILRAPELAAWSVAFSPDGTRIVSTSHEKRVVQRSPTKG